MQPICGVVAAFLAIMPVSLFPMLIPAEAADSSFKDIYQLTSFGSKPSLSPDGQEIIFVSYSTFGPASYPTEIWAIGVDGSNARLVKKTPDDMQALSLQFNPSGNYIAYIGEKLDGSRSIFVMDAMGSNTRSLPDTGKVSTLIWASNNSIIYAEQENENSVSFWQISSDSSDAVLLSRISMTNATRFVVSGNMALTNNNTNLLFTGFGVGQGNSDIFSLDLQTRELRKLDGLEDFFIIGLGRNSHTVFVGQGGGYSITLYSADLENPTEKTQLLDGNLSYSVYESPDGGLVVAYAYAPGGSAPFDANEWGRFGVYVACQDGCGPKPAVFSDDYTIRNGQYVKSSANDIMVPILAAVLIAAGGAGVAIYKKRKGAKK